MRRRGRPRRFKICPRCNHVECVTLYGSHKTPAVASIYMRCAVCHWRGRTMITTATGNSRVLDVKGYEMSLFNLL